MNIAIRFAAGVVLTAGIISARSAGALAQEAPTPSAPQSLARAGLVTGGLNLTPSDAQGHAVHIMPTVQAAKALPKVQSALGVLSYNGGPIMPYIQIYNIFWTGAMQVGGNANLPNHYKNLGNLFAMDYAAHPISSNNTQYSQSAPLQYVTGLTTIPGHSWGGTYYDTNAFPVSGCTSSVTPGNCITDAQIQAEIVRVMGVTGWTGGLNKIYLLYTGQGQGSCFTSASTSCSYTSYCAYHGSISGATPIIYGNEPYADPSFCSAAGQTFPNNDPPADAAVNVASHEVTEAITDPLLNAWWDSANGQEIGDLCAWQFGANTWDGGLANQFWNNHNYELQLEYDNHNASCVQVGP